MINAKKKEPKNNYTLKNINIIMSNLIIPIDYRLNKVINILKSDYDLEEMFISLKKDSSLEVLNIPIVCSCDNATLGVMSLLFKKECEDKELLIQNLQQVNEMLSLDIYMENQKNSDSSRHKNRESVLEIKENLNLSIDNYQDIYSKLNFEIKRSKRYKNKFSAIMFDINNIENFSEYSALKLELLIVNLVKEKIRSVDIFGFWKGYKFIILLPETNLSGASILANRLRKSINDLKGFEIEEFVSSFAVTEYDKLDDDNKIKFITRLEKAFSERDKMKSSTKAV